MRGLARLLVIGMLVVGLLGSAAAGAQSSSMIDDMNPLLGPEYAQWMVGALSQIATKEERSAFQELRNDEDAARFVVAFWSNPDHALIEDIYRQRAVLADDRFSESGVAGRKTDRGTTFILYGEPKEVSYEEFRNVDDPDVELWEYDRKASGKGLTGERPAKAYRFVQVGDLTRMFRKGGPLDPAEQRRRDPRRRPF